jgi:17beta-estradiol 17-dehydrogenase / very-long-chain 3-oxoacyl-CoA reductase
MTCDWCSLSTVGLVFLVLIAVRVAKLVYETYGAKANFKKYLKTGSWAIVTGASEGIGRSMAVELAKQGLNVCVIARTKSKLAEVVAEVQQLKVKGTAVEFDFGAATGASYKQLFAELDKLDVAILVNNVGINYEYANYFAEVDVETDLRLLKVNCESQIQMTKYFLRRLQDKKGGAIVNLSSFTATGAPMPMLATYAATKSFNRGFSNALSFEVASRGIDVLTVMPNLVISKMTQGASTRAPKPSFLKVSSSSMARQTLQKLGSTMETAGHVNHCIIEAVTGLLPTALLGGQVLKMHKDVKRRAEKKKTEAQ